MTILDAPTERKGSQRPSRLWLPPGNYPSRGKAAVDLAAIVGLELDPWQEYVLEGMLRFREDGRWVSTSVGLVVPRQNGKTAVLLARKLAGLFVLGESLIVHTAHEFATAMEAFRDLTALIVNCPELKVELKGGDPRKGVSTANGREGIELDSGQRVRYRARGKSSVRGPSVDCFIFDEAMDLAPEAHRSMLFSSSASPNQQLLYAGSAVDQTTKQDGRVLAGLRHSALTAEPKRTSYFEWSVPGDPNLVTPDVLDDRDMWAFSNPSLNGERVTSIREETVEGEREKTLNDPRAFAVERLNMGDWPALNESVGKAQIPADVWGALLDRRPTVEGRGCLAVDVQPNFRSAAIGASKARPGGGHHLDVVQHEAGTAWVVEAVVGLAEKHDVIGVCIGVPSPATALIPTLQGRGVNVIEVSTANYAKACGRFMLEVEEGILRHGEPDGAVEALTAAVAGASIKASGDSGWYWSRATPNVDITPLVAVTLALYGLEATVNSTAPSFEVLI